MPARLNWKRGRQEDRPGDRPRTLEWIGCNDMGDVVAHVVRVQAGLRSFRAVARDETIVDLHMGCPPDGAEWLACIGPRVVGRADKPLEAVRAVEEALDLG